MEKTASDTYHVPRKSNTTYRILMRNSLNVIYKFEIQFCVFVSNPNMEKLVDIPR